MYPIAPITAGVPLAVAVLSYAGTLVMTVNAAPELACLRSFAAGAREAMTALTRLVLPGGPDGVHQGPDSVPAGEWRRPA